MAYNARGIYLYDETEDEPLFSEFMNLGMGSVSNALKFFGGPQVNREALQPPTGAFWKQTDGDKALYFELAGVWERYNPEAVIGASAGSTLHGTSICTLDRDTGLVSLRAQFNRTAWAANQVVGTLPVGFRPALSTNSVLTFHGATAPYVSYGEITSGGDLKITAAPTNGQSWNVTFTALFKAAA